MPLNARFFVHFNGVFQTLFYFDFSGQIGVEIFPCRKSKQKGSEATKHTISAGIVWLAPHAETAW